MIKITKSKLILNNLLISSFAFAQTTVFEDNFNRTGPGVPDGGTPNTTYTVTSFNSTTSMPGSGLARLTNTHNAGGTNGSPTITLADNGLNLYMGTTTHNGSIFVSSPIASFATPFNSTLKSNTDVVEWSFNVRTNRGAFDPALNVGSNSLSGFATNSSNYGLAVILAASNPDLLQGTGYAITINKLPTGTMPSDQVTVVGFRKFSNGVSTAASGSTTPSSLTLLGSYSQPAGKIFNFISVRVTYNPADDKWSLYVRDDGDATWNNPSTGVTNLVTEVIDNQYVTAPMQTFGFLFKHGTSSSNQNQAFFDNFKVALLPIPLSNNSFIDKSITLGSNPVDDILQVKLNSKIINGYEIFNSLGQVVKKSNKISSNDISIDVSDLEKSVYFLKAYTSDSKESFTKFIKQ